MVLILMVINLVVQRGGLSPHWKMMNWVINHVQNSTPGTDGAHVHMIMFISFYLSSTWDVSCMSHKSKVEIITKRDQ